MKVRTFKHTSDHKVLKKCLRFTGYNLQLLYKRCQGDDHKTYDFIVDIMKEVDNDEQFLNSVILSDEASFKVSVYVHRQCKNLGNDCLSFH